MEPDNPHNPLIPTEFQHNDDDGGVPDPGLRPSCAEPRPAAFVLLLTFSAGIGGFLFGYDTGVLSSVLVSIGKSLSHRMLTSLDKSIITSSTSLLALLISPFSSLLADRFGRKCVILYADALFILGAAIQAASCTVALMTTGRCLIGAAVGAASFAVPLYISEIAPAAYRGRLVTMNVLFITLGQVTAYLVGWVFSTYGSTETGWRWIVGLGSLPAMLQAAVMVSMPETPRWLVKAGKPELARLVVQRVNGQICINDGNFIIKQIETELRHEEESRILHSNPCIRYHWTTSWQKLISEGRNRRALAIACLLQGLQQLCGFNSLMYFSATIFALMGFKNPALTSMTVAITNFVFTVVALAVVDKVGRRRILLYSLPWMILGLVLSSYGFSLMSLDEPWAYTRSNLENASGAVIVLGSILVYVAAYAVGLGNVPWMQSELFPLTVRSVGSGLASMTNWSANFLIGLTFLLLIDVLGPSYTFILYACVCLVGYIMVWKIYPETTGLSLEEIATLLENDWGVK